MGESCSLDERLREQELLAASTKAELEAIGKNMATMTRLLERLSDISPKIDVLSQKVDLKNDDFEKRIKALEDKTNATTKWIVTSLIVAISSIIWQKIGGIK